MCDKCKIYWKKFPLIKEGFRRWNPLVLLCILNLKCLIKIRENTVFILETNGIDQFKKYRWTYIWFIAGFEVKQTNSINFNKEPIDIINS